MKTKFFFPALVLMLSATCINANASTVKSNMKETVAGMTDEQKAARIEVMKNRVQEIKETKKSELSRADRKDMRTELKTMNKEAKEIGHGGIYLTLGGIIIIILVLILVL